MLPWRIEADGCPPPILTLLFAYFQGVVAVVFLLQACSLWHTSYDGYTSHTQFSTDSQLELHVSIGHHPHNFPSHIFHQTHQLSLTQLS
ncbi:hypothetical protein D3C77_753760 [compost metagenome]